MAPFAIAFVLLTGAPVVVVQVDAAEYAKRVVEPHRGRVLVVNFWSTNCGYCMREMPALLAWAAHHASNVDFVIVADARAPDDDALVAALTKWRVTVPAFAFDSRVGHDDDDVFEHTVNPSWNGTMPHTLVYARDGKVARVLHGTVRPETLSAIVSSL